MMKTEDITLLLQFANIMGFSVINSSYRTVYSLGLFIFLCHFYIAKNIKKFKKPGSFRLRAVNEIVSSSGITACHELNFIQRKKKAFSKSS